MHIFQTKGHVGLNINCSYINWQHFLPVSGRNQPSKEMSTFLSLNIQNGCTSLLTALAFLEQRRNKSILSVRWCFVLCDKSYIHYNFKYKRHFLRQLLSVYLQYTMVHNIHLNNILVLNSNARGIFVPK